MVRLKASCYYFLAFQYIFQFQYGTIESEIILRKDEIFANFNSSMVRLKVGDPWICREDRAEFQFQYGTIESHGEFESIYRDLTDFNSSMVRLKEFSNFTPDMALRDFNSSMVRLKVLLPWSQLQFLPHFNSSMVRLKDLKTASGGEFN